jgi:hypothetical protein
LSDILYFPHSRYEKLGNGLDGETLPCPGRVQLRHLPVPQRCLVLVIDTSFSDLLYFG